MSTLKNKIANILAPKMYPERFNTHKVVDAIIQAMREEIEAMKKELIYNPDKDAQDFVRIQIKNMEIQASNKTINELLEKLK